ncbi:hypothetical protein K4K61_001702, partial [Colletotrichum sp. SAR11_59]
MADHASADAAHAQRDGTPTSPNPKRPRVDHGIDPDVTPRGHRTQPINAEIAENETESAASSDTGRVSNRALSICSQTSLAKSSGSKKRSRQSSPRKQAALMEIEDVAETMTFTGRAAPPEQLKALNARLDRLNRTGKGILSNTAKIHPDYNQTGKRSHYNRKVDFCVFLKQDTPALRVAARTSPINSVNHTDYPALLSRPIFFSIETKDSGDKWVDATNQ